jgi:hypothetical protein
MGAVEQNFLHNTALACTEAPQVVTLRRHKSFSDLAMARLLAEGHAGQFDCIYIDGSHEAPVAGAGSRAEQDASPNGALLTQPCLRIQSNSQTEPPPWLSAWVIVPAAEKMRRNAATDILYGQLHNGPRAAFLHPREQVRSGAKDPNAEI